MTYVMMKVMKTTHKRVRNRLAEVCTYCSWTAALFVSGLTTEVQAPNSCSTISQTSCAAEDICCRTCDTRDVVHAEFLPMGLHPFPLVARFLSCAAQFRPLLLFLEGSPNVVVVQRAMVSGMAILEREVEKFERLLKEKKLL